MPLRKLWLLAVLATVVAFAAVEKLDVQTSDPTLNLRPQHEVSARDESPSYTGQSAKLVRLSWAFQTKSKLPLTAFLPSRNPKDLAAGKLLVASRDLGDPNFAQTVILLVQCDAKGVVGLTLNRRTTVPLSQALEQLKAAKDRSDPVYLGGPVEIPDVFALLGSTVKVEGAQQIFEGLYFISSRTVFEKTISGRPDPDVFHVYMGYAGWDYVQLRREVELGAWFIFPADAGTVFESDPDSMWRDMIKKTELKLAGILPRAISLPLAYVRESN